MGPFRVRVEFCLFASVVMALGGPCLRYAVLDAALDCERGCDEVSAVFFHDIAFPLHPCIEYEHPSCSDGIYYWVPDPVNTQCSRTAFPNRVRRIKECSIRCFPRASEASPGDNEDPGDAEPWFGERRSKCTPYTGPMA